MYIKCNRNEILKKKAEWEEKYKARKAQYDEQDTAFKTAQYDWSDNLEKLIREQFNSYIDKLPGLIIEVSPWGGLRREVSVRIRYEERNNRDDISLRWDYKIELSIDGEVIKESNSWSGFQAVTPEQVDDLINSANFLKAIVDFDWAPLLQEAKDAKPEYDDYMTIKNPDYDPEYKDPGFDKQLEEYDINNIIGKDLWIKAKYTLAGYSHSSTGYVQIVGDTPKYYKVKAIDEYYLTSGVNAYVNNIIDAKDDYVSKVSKDKIHFNKPLEIITTDDLRDMIS